jgi:putative hemin transport protein
MAEPVTPTPETIREARLEFPKLRERDLADQLGISEAQLMAAHAGTDVVRIAAHPDRLIGAIEGLGSVMALTRNESCVNEKTGEYANYTSGDHAAMVLNHDIDLRIFPNHWVHGFAIRKATEQGIRRSFQVFDAAGDSIHKVFLKDETKVGAWEDALAALKIENQSQALSVAPRQPTETAKADPERVDVLRKEWSKMTDTHQFMRLTSKLKMNRLGAYRIAGEPFVRALAANAVDQMLTEVQKAGIGVMVFVGNRGCIQIHSGPLVKLQPMGPWLNVLDPGFNLHLRGDHIAEVWAVDKPTQRGPAVSVEAFDKDGGLILQVFGIGRDGHDTRPAWRQIVAGLPQRQMAEAAE